MLWINIACFELVIFLTTMIKGFTHLRHGPSSLISSLYHHNVLYFLAIFSISATNATLSVADPYGRLIRLGQMQRVLHSVLCCRLILDLRASARRTQLSTASAVDNTTLLAACFDRAANTESEIASSYL
ncbi:hypothetical protein AURDEDRAFT_175667 [Auricularia subglabra TFB-10046 SS5]|uniref:Uncharacterized protein n=1 Tax=Auricularia subglabra (strain TFB-10046 / SS5) TaxID=717982 RepID=J0WRC3_AURST|nr:hypothetical protein AURDEDRAFT_175667 [Auricularia subglabra TFB-10046 SS5]